MTNGIGATVGTLSAGAIVNSFCSWNEQGYLDGNWTTCWFVFAGYALVVAVLFALLFENPEKKKKA
jgi:NHS family nucleoside permease-like MFS transporter